MCEQIQFHSTCFFTAEEAVFLRTGLLPARLKRFPIWKDVQPTLRFKARAGLHTAQTGNGATLVMKRHVLKIESPTQAETGKFMTSHAKLRQVSSIDNLQGDFVMSVS